MVYLHIPFCDSKCFYCAFNSYIDRFDRIQAYMKALYHQLAYELQRFETPVYSIRSVFIGGGTPSCVPASLYAPLFLLLEPFLTSDAEITIEANPNSASLEWIKEMKHLGVNRISFGVQSFHEEKLRFLGRAHSTYQAQQSVDFAHRAGINEINVDIIYGTSLDTQELLNADLHQALSLGVNHLSCYALTIEQGTKTFLTPSNAANDEPLGKFVASTLIENGFEHYEISNFGRSRCRHNMGYWEGKNYIGAGSGAVGFLKNERFYPTKDLDKYINNPLETERENLSNEDLKIEKILLGLRSCVGFDLSLLIPQEETKLHYLLDEGKVTLKGKKVYSTDYFLADEIALYLVT